ACVVRTIEELTSQLERYCHGQLDMANFYLGEVKRNKNALPAFAADEEMQEAIAKWIQRGKWHKLAELWVQGLAFDWTSLYGQIKPQRMHLPTYPFAKQRYWVASAGKTSDLATVALHPLVQRNTSNLDEQRFSSTFTGGEFFLTDHVVQGQKLLPGAAYLEMARAAVQQASPMDGSGVRLENVVFARPAVVGVAPLELHIALEREGDAKVAFEIYSGAGDDTVVHSQGQAVLASAGEAPSIDLAALTGQCDRLMSAEECYAAFARMGLAYGAAFQGLEQVSVGPAMVLGKIKLPAAVASTKDDYVLHPSVVDAALQASIGLLQGDADKPALPFALERLEVFAALPAQATVVVRHSDGSDAQAAVQKVDLD